jgi:hypothetical protein
LYECCEKLINLAIYRFHNIPLTMGLTNIGKLAVVKKNGVRKWRETEPKH